MLVGKCTWILWFHFFPHAWPVSWQRQDDGAIEGALAVSDNALIALAELDRQVSDA